MPYKTPELRRANYLANKELVKKQSADWAKANRANRRADYTKWAKANPEKVKARRKAHYEANADKSRADAKAWREANPEKAKADISKWRKDNPEKCRQYIHKRRTMKTKAGGYFTPEEWFTLCFATAFKCLCCNEIKPLVADHVIPVILGGPSWLWNIQPLCQTCNSKKGTKIIDYRETLGENEWPQLTLLVKM
jgi:5-methylcytosine-specific restriction endonuclease McrA